MYMSDLAAPLTNKEMEDFGILPLFYEKFSETDRDMIDKVIRSNWEGYQMPTGVNEDFINGWNAGFKHCNNTNKVAVWYCVVDQESVDKEVLTYRMLTVEDCTKYGIPVEFLTKQKEFVNGN